MNLYLSGPMSGFEYFNYPSFHMLAKKLRAAGHIVINPADFSHPDPGNWVACMRKDLIALLQMEEPAVVVLPGWEKSKGASLEVFTATLFNIPILRADTLEIITIKFHFKIWEEKLIS